MNVDSVDIARDTAVTEWKIPQAKLIENTTGNAAQIPPPEVSFQNEYIISKIYVILLDYLEEELTYDKEHKDSKNNDKTAVTEPPQPKVSGFKSDWILIGDCSTPATLENRCVGRKNKV